MYELAILLAKYATTPFKGSSRQKTFQNILEIPVGFPEHPKVTSWVSRSPFSFFSFDYGFVFSSLKWGRE